jgi:prepilin-type N-terminal cleavage/methylation domain-containing protein
MGQVANSIRRGRRGFTLVEILAAMLFMAIVIPITVEGLIVANRFGQVAERKRQAAQLADEMLTELVLTGGWQTGNQSGNFGEDYPGFTWTLTNETWVDGALTQVSIEVTFKVQEQDYIVRLITLADPNQVQTTTS